MNPRLPTTRADPFLPDITPPLSHNTGEIRRRLAFRKPRPAGDGHDGMVGIREIIKLYRNKRTNARFLVN